MSMHDVAVKMLELYVSNYDRAVIGSHGTYTTTSNVNIQAAMIEQHSKNKYSVSVFGNAKSSRFVCFDVDTEDAASDVYTLVDALSSGGFPRDKIYVSLSGYKGYHVEMFFDDLVPTKLLKRVHKYVCAICEFDPYKIELRPTYTQAIKLPLGTHPRTGNMCWYVDVENGLMPISEYDYVLGIEQIPKQEAVKIIFENFPIVTEWKRKSDLIKSKEAKASEPALKITGDKYPDITDSHTRHHIMMSIALYERRKGTPSEEIEKKLCDWVDRQDPSKICSTLKEAYDDAADLAGWVWKPGFSIIEESRSIAKKDFERVLEFRSANDKKIAYLILLATKKWGHGVYSCQRIADLVGCSYSTAFHSLERLEEAGVLKKKHGRRLFDAKTQSYVQEPNIYTFISHAPQEGDEIIDVDLSAAQAPDSSTYNELYLRAVAANVGEERWRELFTKKERDALYDYV